MEEKAGWEETCHCSSFCIYFRRGGNQLFSGLRDPRCNADRDDPSCLVIRVSNQIWQSLNQYPLGRVSLLIDSDP